MIQTLDVISVNLWQILISLANLVILFVLLKKFLYKPVKNLLAQRQAEIDKQYSEAQSAQDIADASKREWDERMKGAQDEADKIVKSATEKAEKRRDKIVSDAKIKADEIVRQAEADAELELKKASEQIKQEIVTVSTALTEKMLDREINEQDHRELINSFIEDIGDDGDE